MTFETALLPGLYIPDILTEYNQLQSIAREYSDENETCSTAAPSRRGGPYLVGFNCFDCAARSP